MSPHAQAVSFPFVSTSYISLWLGSLPPVLLSTREVWAVPGAVQTRCDPELPSLGWHSPAWVAPGQAGGKANSLPLLPEQVWCDEQHRAENK